MTYVDGFLIPVPDDRKGEFRAFNERWAPWFIKEGALATYDCWGDDVPDGEVTDFARAVALKSNETVVFSWMIWPDKATRDAAYTKMAAIEPEEDIPFDGKRMVFGGFAPLTVFEQNGG